MSQARKEQSHFPPEVQTLQTGFDPSHGLAPVPYRNCPPLELSNQLSTSCSRGSDWGQGFQDGSENPLLFPPRARLRKCSLSPPTSPSVSTVPADFKGVGRGSTWQFICLQSFQDLLFTRLWARMTHDPSQDSRGISYECCALVHGECDKPMRGPGSL